MSAWLPSISQHLMWSTVALLVYVVNTRVRRMRRAPTAAIAWVMGLAVFPYLMLPLYLLFGQRKLKAPPPRQPSRCAQTHWAAILIDSFGLPPPGPVQVRFHSDGAQAREALWEVLESARHQLDLSTFLVGDDVLGREVIERLTRRASEGIKVRLLLDGAGAWLAARPSFSRLRAAGAEVAVFHPLLGLRRLGPRNLRNHRKLVLADGVKLWSGGRNLAAEYFTGDETREPWIDLSFDLTGPVAGTAARQFEADWAAATARTPLHSPEDLPVSPGTLAQFLPSGPDQPEDTAQVLLIAACFRAERRLLAVTPYFVPDESLLAALRLAALRGVRVTVVLPVASNHRLADFVRGRPLRELARAGAQILLVPQMVHAKAVVIDESLALCGSINLDARSLLINYESAVVFYGAAEINWLAQWIGDLSAKSAPFVPRPPGLVRDVAEGLLLTIAFQL